jgi:DMSO/TMAO reductase YedYZ molybdopterin-dependent catalytic subunit
MALRNGSRIIRSRSQSSEAGLFSRRTLIRLTPLALLSACNLRPEGKTETFLKKIQQFNDRVQASVFDPNRLSPELPDSDLTPLKDFRVNTDSPHDLDLRLIDANVYSLEVGGLVARPGHYSVDQIKALPKRVQNTKHVCVEGWSMNPKWGGARIVDFLSLVGADPRGKYVYVTSADGYYTSYDIASARQTQSLLCYEAYNTPLTLEHGAPVRIVMPTKLGYKSAKWIISFWVTDQKPGGYWEDDGYDWFAGI